VPGLGNLEKRRAEHREIISSVKLTGKTGEAVQRAGIGKGVFLVGTDLEAMLREAGVSRETGVDLGLQFVRRADSRGHIYFLANRGERMVDGFVTLGVSAKSAAIFDPRFESRIGMAAVRKDTGGSTQVYLQLQPGESCILRTFAKEVVEGPQWQYLQWSGAACAVAGTWKVGFVEGGPELPAGFQTKELESWTKLGGSEAICFAGTGRYTIEFDQPTVAADDWLLDLGKVVTVPV